MSMPVGRYPRVRLFPGNNKPPVVAIIDKSVVGDGDDNFFRTVRARVDIEQLSTGEFVLYAWAPGKLSEEDQALVVGSSSEDKKVLMHNLREELERKLERRSDG